MWADEISFDDSTDIAADLWQCTVDVINVISMIFPPPAFTMLATAFNSYLNVVFASTLGRVFAGRVKVILSGFLANSSLYLSGGVQSSSISSSWLSS